MDKTSPVTSRSDKELAADAAAGIQTSFEQLMSRYSPRLFYFLRQRAASDQDIEDLIQETFLKAFRGIGQYSPKWKFSTWLYTIASRLTISHYRSKRPESLSFIPQDTSTDPQKAILRKEQSRNIWSIARSLKQKEYEVLWLHYAEDMSTKEIGEIMRKKPITIRVLLHRARLNLAKKIKLSAHFKTISGKASAEQNPSFP